MPNLDGGHYFLTVLAPVRTDTMIDPIVGRSRSHEQILSQKLALLPTGRQTASSPHDAPPSPFAANTLNHLARFVIIGGPAFNGRNSGDSLVSMAQGINPLAAQKVDGLSTPYLLFAADIDAPGDGAQVDGDRALRAYTDTLWATMQHDLAAIFRHCVGFETVATADAFHDYIRKCQIETTMPFNDYWLDGLTPPEEKLPLAAVKATGFAAVGVLLAWLAAVILNGVLVALRVKGHFGHVVGHLAAWGVIVVPLLIVLLLLALAVLYRWVMRRGASPFPTAPGADLPSVLKALFVQQHFTQFAIATQGEDDASLHARFGAFLRTVQPEQPAPTQPPGVVGTPELESV